MHACMHAHTKCLLPYAIYRVLTTSALAGAKVDMSTIHTNYKTTFGMSDDIRLLLPWAEHEKKKNKNRLFNYSERPQRHVVDSFQINL